MTIDHNTTNQLPHNELYIALYSICIVCKLTKLVKTSQIHKKRHLIYTGTQINTEDISSSVHLCGCCMYPSGHFFFTDTLHPEWWQNKSQHKVLKCIFYSGSCYCSTDFFLLPFTHRKMTGMSWRIMIKHP